MSECNLHTIVKLPAGLFYAGITTNILFFDKGEKTDGIWYYQVPLPEGYRSFSKTKPFTAEHLKGVREWWNNRDNGDINAYFVKQDKIEETYNIDFKNPNIKEEKQDYTLHQLVDMIEEKSKSISDSVAQLKELIKDIEE